MTRKKSETCEFTSDKSYLNFHKSCWIIFWFCAYPSIKSVHLLNLKLHILKRNRKYFFCLTSSRYNNHWQLIFRICFSMNKCFYFEVALICNFKLLQLPEDFGNADHFWNGHSNVSPGQEDFLLLPPACSENHHCWVVLNKWECCTWAKVCFLLFFWTLFVQPSKKLNNNFISKVVFSCI